MGPSRAHPELRGVAGPRSSGASGAELGRLTSTDVDPAALTLVVPLGATEQHGPHLPLNTDTVIVEAVTAGLAQRRPVAVAPALPFGSSGEHDAFAGTISIGQQALEKTAIEIVRGGGSWRGVLLACWHGGNRAALDRVKRQIASEGQRAQVWLGASAGGDAHAGRTETSLMMAIDPTAVAPGRCEPGNRAPLSELMPNLRRGGVAGVSANGILGDPTGASATEGEAILARLVADLCRAHDRLLERTRSVATRGE